MESVWIRADTLNFAERMQAATALRKEKLHLPGRGTEKGVNLIAPSKVLRNEGRRRGSKNNFSSQDMRLPTS